MALLTKVKTRMAIHAHRKVRSLLDGEYASVHTGRSMDFNDLREYVIGDDVKDLDWRASARKGELLIKRYVADRKHTILLVVSASRSMAGLCDADHTKSEVAILASGIMGHLATKHSDYVGLILGNAEQKRSIRPSSSEVALERMLVEIQNHTTSEAAGQDLDGLLSHVIRTVRRRTILLVVADDVALGEAEQANLRRLRAQHEILFLAIGDLDPGDASLAGRTLIDVEQGTGLPDFVAADAELHAEVQAADQERQAERRRTLERLGIASEHITGEADVVPAVFRLLERHRHAKR